MAIAGGMPEPLLPADVALPNPHHLEGSVVYQVLPTMGVILIMLDHDGDENYEPVFVPIDGGIPEPVFGDRLSGMQVVCTACDEKQQIALFLVDTRQSPVYEAYRANLAERSLTLLGKSVHHGSPESHDATFETILLVDSNTVGDEVLYLWRNGEKSLLFGTPLEDRPDGAEVLNGIRTPRLVDDGVLMVSSLFDDHYGLTWFTLDAPDQPVAVEVRGLRHTDEGELSALDGGLDEPMRLIYNIDGASWIYEGEFDKDSLTFNVIRTLVGEDELAEGVAEAIHYEAATGRYALSFSSTTSPSQLYVLEPDGAIKRLTNERPVGIPTEWLARGESMPYISHDGLRMPARLYLPAPELGYAGPRPVVFYIHGGPQSQERPDFTWFSMPMIQYLTLKGFAVWVPNVRGSEGYGLAKTKMVDHDWGGQDRLDHIAAFDFLKGDARLDMTRVGVMGRSYGGYMTLTLAGRHPDRWKAAVDMFGPYNLFTFMERLPETWKTYFYLAVGHPEKEADFLRERSPSTHMHNLACPMLVIQGAHDPRVTERESRDVVEQLRAQGKGVEYVVYADEGHDVITYANKVDCYSRIADFFSANL
jgi:dipeptidyl aminopeptidase/acylaminoacyl peptidase